MGTPVEKIGALWFKREDKFVPLGYGGINGSKRVCVWLISEAVKKGAAGVVHRALTGTQQLEKGSFATFLPCPYSSHRATVTAENT